MLKPAGAPHSPEFCARQEGQLSVQRESTPTHEWVNPKDSLSGTPQIIPCGAVHKKVTGKRGKGREEKKPAGA